MRPVGAGARRLGGNCRYGHCSTGELVAYSARLAIDQQLLNEMSGRFKQTMFSQRLAQVVGECMPGFGDSKDERTFGRRGIALIMH